MDPPFSPSQLRFGERMQRPALSNREFRRRRQELYPHTRDDGFPNDDIREGYDFYKGREHEETFAREDYNHADRAARRAMERMRVDESEYYDRATGGYTPDQHRDLLPRANTWENRAREHAQAREDVLDRYPYMYQNVHGQAEHYDYTRGTWGKVDKAHDRADFHSRYASSGRDHDRRRDPYGRGVPDSFEPYDDEPYPQGFPPEGRFSTRYGRDPERTKRLSWR